MRPRVRDPLDITKILSILPHRYPLLLVDRVLEVEPGKRLVAVKNVTINEEFFSGHFPGRPVMPGVLVVEAMAQAGALLAYHSADYGESSNKEIFLMGLDEVRFRRPVVPGDQLRLEVETLRQKGGIWKQRAVALVEGQKAAEAQLLAMVRDKETE